jgi:hypothetical protein
MKLFKKPANALLTSLRINTLVPAKSLFLILIANANKTEYISNYTECDTNAAVKPSLISWVELQNVQVSDTRDDDSSNAA